MDLVLVNLLGSLSLPRNSVVRLTDRPDMTIAVYRGCKATRQQTNKQQLIISDRGRGYSYMDRVVELQWLEQLWDYENLFETGVVQATDGLL